MSDEQLRKHINDTIEKNLNSIKPEERQAAAKALATIAKLDLDLHKTQLTPEESRTQRLALHAMTTVDMGDADSSIDRMSLIWPDSVHQLQQQLSEFNNGHLKLSAADSTDLRSQLKQRTDAPQMFAPLTPEEAAYIEDQKLQQQNKLGIAAAGIGAVPAMVAAVGGARPPVVNSLLNFAGVEMMFEGISPKAARSPFYRGPDSAPLGLTSKGASQRGSINFYRQPSEIANLETARKVFSGASAAELVVMKGKTKSGAVMLVTEGESLHLIRIPKNGAEPHEVSYVETLSDIYMTPVRKGFEKNISGKPGGAQLIVTPALETARKVFTSASAAELVVMKGQTKSGAVLLVTEGESLHLIRIPKDGAKPHEVSYAETLNDIAKNLVRRDFKETISDKPGGEALISRPVKASPPEVAQFSDKTGKLTSTNGVASELQQSSSNLPPRESPQLVELRTEFTRLKGLASQYSTIVEAYDTMLKANLKISKLDNAIARDEQRYSREHPGLSYAESDKGAKQIARLEVLKATPPESKYQQAQRDAKVRFDEAAAKNSENHQSWVPWPRTDDEFGDLVNNENATRQAIVNVRQVALDIERTAIAEKNIRPSTSVPATGQAIDVLPEQRKLVKLVDEMREAENMLNNWESYSQGAVSDESRPQNPSNRLLTQEGMVWLQSYNKSLFNVYGRLTPSERKTSLPEYFGLEIAKAELDYVKGLAQQQYVQVRRIENYNQSLAPHPQHVAQKTPAEIAVGEAQQALLRLAQAQQQSGMPYMNIDFKSLSEAAQQGTLPPALRVGFEVYQTARAQAPEITANNPLIFKSPHLSSILHEVDSPGQLALASPFKYTFTINTKQSGLSDFAQFSLMHDHCTYVAEVITHNLLGTRSSAMSGYLPEHVVVDKRIQPHANVLRGLSSHQVEAQMQMWGDGAIAWVYSKGHVSVIVNDAGEIKVIEGQGGLHFAKLDDLSAQGKFEFELVRRDYTPQLERPAGFEPQTPSAAPKNEPVPTPAEPVPALNLPPVDYSPGR